MLSEEYTRMMLIYLSSLVEGPGFRSTQDLNRLSSRELLILAGKVDDSALSLFVQLLKTSLDGASLFEKLMGDHEEENRELVDAFFSRYLNLVLANAQETAYFNPLEVYMPAHTFDDLAFLQSRQSFFLRQTIDTINEYLKNVLDSSRRFQPGQQEEAWKYFWGRVSHS